MRSMSAIGGSASGGKKILFSLSGIVAVAAIAVASTGALFSDTETSTGNTFAAGAIDLTVKSECTYNGAASTECGTWSLKDLIPTADKFFNFTDLKPGDVGENTVTLKVVNNDSWVCAAVSNLADNENGQNGPETKAEAISDPNGTVGELSKNLEMTIWRDTNCDNVLDTTLVAAHCANISPATLCERFNDDQVFCGMFPGDCAWVPEQPAEAVLATGHPVNGVMPVYDSTTGTGALPGNTNTCLGASWTLPLDTGNEVQTDIMTGDIGFNVVQSRNNSNFRCINP